MCTYVHARTIAHTSTYDHNIRNGVSSLVFGRISVSRLQGATRPSSQCHSKPASAVSFTHSTHFDGTRSRRHGDAPPGPARRRNLDMECFDTSHLMHTGCCLSPRPQLAGARPTARNPRGAQTKRPLGRRVAQTQNPRQRKRAALPTRTPMARPAPHCHTLRTTACMGQAPHHAHALAASKIEASMSLRPSTHFDNRRMAAAHKEATKRCTTMRPVRSAPHCVRVPRLYRLLVAPRTAHPTNVTCIAAPLVLLTPPNVVRRMGKEAAMKATLVQDHKSVARARARQSGSTFDRNCAAKETQRQDDHAIT